MLDEKLIEIDITGFSITHFDTTVEESDINETFVPMNAYRLTNKQARMFIPSTHEIMDIKRTKIKRYGTYSDLMQATTK